MFVIGFGGCAIEEAQEGNSKEESPYVQGESEQEDLNKIKFNKEGQEDNESQEIETVNNDNEKYIFTDEFGELIDIRKADIIYGPYNKEFTPEEAFEQEWFIARYYDCTYLTKSKGVSYNTVTDPFDYEKEVFNIEVPEHNYEFFKVSAGDKFGTLTVKEVYRDYSFWNGSDYSTPHMAGELYISFSGSFSVSGYITTEQFLKIDEEESSNHDNWQEMIIFLADAETWGDVPIRRIGQDTSVSSYPVPSYADSHYYDIEKNGFMKKNFNDCFYYSSDIGTTYLGSARFDYNDVDISAIPRDGKYAHVTVTITDFYMISSPNKSIGGNWGKIESVLPFSD